MAVADGIDSLGLDVRLDQDVIEWLMIRLRVPTIAKALDDLENLGARPLD